MLLYVGYEQLKNVNSDKLLTVTLILKLTTVRRKYKNNIVQ